MEYAEFKKRVLEVYKESRRVTSIAAGILRRRYGKYDERYANAECSTISRIWKREGLEIVSLPDYVSKRMRHYARFNRNPERIADAISREIREFILGYSIRDETIRQNMEGFGIKPARKPRYKGGGSRKTGKNICIKSLGTRITSEQRKRYRYALPPEIMS